jgi:hypothetical protein
MSYGSLMMVVSLLTAVLVPYCIPTACDGLKAAAKLLVALNGWA